MKKKNLIIITIITLLTVCTFYYLFSSKETEENNKINEDALVFKFEYEEHNGLIGNSEFPAQIFKELNIPEDNPFVYANYDEIARLIEEGGTGVVYLGFPTCEWCRNIVSVLTDAATEFGVEHILYRNISEDRNILSLDSENNIITEKAGDIGYLHLLELLGERAPLYLDINDEQYRRIYVPVVVFIQEGNIIGYVQSLEAYSKRVSEEELGGWIPMNEEETEALTEIYLDYFDRIFN